MKKFFIFLFVLFLSIFFGSKIFAQTGNFTITSVVQNGPDVTFHYTGYPGEDCAIIVLRGNTPSEGAEEAEQGYAADNTCEMTSGSFTLTPDTFPDRYYIVLVADTAGNTYYTNNFPVVNGTYPSTPTPTSTPAPTVVPIPITASFNPSADTYVKSGSDNRNTGAGLFMRLQASGDNRGLVRFDQATLQSTIGSSSSALISVKLRLTITDNGNNWGTGRTIDVHRLLQDWTEGNGTETTRGSGAGATWECGSDTNIANQSKNCTGVTEWEMGQPNNFPVHPWAQSASATQTITNSQSGVVEFDVTRDVAAFLNGTQPNYGWIIKKTDEGQNGQVSFGTKESTFSPQLIVTYQP